MVPNEIIAPPLEKTSGASVSRSCVAYYWQSLPFTGRACLAWWPLARCTLLILRFKMRVFDVNPPDGEGVVISHVGTDAR
jgi:hypothetical protein